jgi:arsenate reductase
VKVLFLCIHNTCRSVIAEAIFNAKAKLWCAESAGISAAEKIDEKAREILERMGYTVKKDKPRRIDELDLKSYDLIVSVCSESCIPADIQWYIEDPSGKDEEFYLKVINEISSRVDELIARLEGGSG